MAYGLFDTQDNLWMCGEDEGPKSFADSDLAGIAAQILDEQLGNPIGRIRAKELPPGPFRVRDEVKVKRSALKALQRIEGKVQ